MIIKYCFSLCIFVTILNAYCNELPDYKIVVDAQMKCDDRELKQIPWDKRSGIWKLAYKTVSIISDMKLSEEVRVQKKNVGKHRDFRLEYTPYARIICGEVAEIEEKPKLTRELPVIIGAFKRPGYFDIYDNDEVHQEVSYLDYMKYTDQLNPPGMDGLSCLVDVRQFLEDPLNSINLKKICKGENKKQIEFTKKEILRVADILRKRLLSQGSNAGK